MSDKEPSKAEFGLWKNHPVTKFVTTTLQEIRDHYAEGLGSEQIHLQKGVIRGKFLGMLIGLDYFLTMEIEDRPQEDKIVDGEFQDVTEQKA